MEPGDPFHAPKDSAEYEEFFDAAASGDVARLEKALSQRLNVNALESDKNQGHGALHIAAEMGDVPMIQCLLSHGAQVNLRRVETETPLHDAAYQARCGAITALLDAGADIHSRAAQFDGGEYNPLHCVLKYKDTVTPEMTDAIRLLLDRGADLNGETDDYGGSILIDLACKPENNIELVRMLIDRGAHMDNALPVAAWNYDLVKLLLENGAKISRSYIQIYNDGPSHNSALTKAASAGNVEVVRLLLSYADGNDRAVSTDALVLANEYGHTEVVKLLLAHGF